MKRGILNKFLISCTIIMLVGFRCMAFYNYTIYVRGESINYHSYKYRIVVTYKDASPIAYNLLEENMDESKVCHQFLDINSNTATKVITTALTPTSFNIEVSGKTQNDWQDWGDEGTIDYNSPNDPIHFEWSRTASSEKWEIFIDGIISPICKLTPNCESKIDSFKVLCPPYFNDNCNGQLANLQIYIDGTWVTVESNLDTSGDTINQTVAKLKSYGYKLGHNFKYRISRSRCYWGYDHIFTQETEEEIFFDIQPDLKAIISAPAVCSGLPNNITISNLDTGYYSAILQKGSDTGSNRKFFFTIGVDSSKVKYLYSGDSASVGGVLTLIEGETWTVNLERTSTPNGCPLIKYPKIQANKPVPNIASVTNTTNICPGTSEGAIGFSITNFSAYLSFTLKNNGTTVSRAIEGTNPNYFYSDLPQGNYTFRVTEYYGCFTDYNDTIKIGYPAFSLEAKTENSDCHSNNGGNNGEISVTRKGGIGNVDIKYNGSSIGFPHKNLTAGTYTYTAKDGCTQNATLEVVLSGASSELELNKSLTYDKCLGKIGVSVNSGGKSPFTYKLNEGSYSSFTYFDNLNAGTYKVAVKDANECVDSIVGITIEKYNKPKLTFGTIHNVECYGEKTGYIQITGATKGGIGATATNVNIDTITVGVEKYTSWPITAMITSGTYNVIVSDQYCANTYEKTISEPTNGKLIFSTTNPNVVTNQVCSYNKNGQIVVKAEKGWAGAYSYILKRDDIIDSLIRSTNSFDTLPPATYTVKVIDSNGCVIGKTETVGAYTDPLLTNNDYTIKNKKCWNTDDGWVKVINKASIKQTADIEEFVLYGGLLPNNYVNTSGLFNGLKLSSTYSLFVEDKNGCYSDTIHNIVVSQRDTMKFSLVSLKHQTCNYNIDSPLIQPANGEINISVSGGTNHYPIFKLQDNSEDVVGKSYPNTLAGISKSINLLPPSNEYSIIVEDDSSCNITYDFDINNYTNPIFYDYHVDSTPAVCYNQPNGKINIRNFSPSEDGDGNSPSIKGFYLKWPTPSTHIDSIKTNLTLPIIFEDLRAKIDTNYFIYAIDNNNCKSNELGQEVTQPGELIVTAEWRKNVTCFNDNKDNDDGSLHYAIVGGNDIGWTERHILYKAGTGDLPDLRSGYDFNGLSKGRYKVKYTDTEGCFDESNEITIDGPDTRITATLSTTLVDCHINDDNSSNSPEKNNGTIRAINVSGGYDRSVNNNYNKYLFALKEDKDSEFSTPKLSNEFIGEPVGNYTIKIIDHEGCDTYRFSDSITSQEELKISGTPYDEICEGTNTGEVTFSSLGGLGFHTYVLDRIDQGFTAIPPNNGTNAYNRLAPASDYILTVKDSLECERSTLDTELEILAYTDPKLKSDTLKLFDWVQCYGESNGILKLHNIQKGYNDGPIFHPIDTLFFAGRYKATSRIITNSFESVITFDSLPCDRYDIFVVDTNHCRSNIISDSVLQPELLELWVDSVWNEICYADTNGKIFIDYKGGNDPSYTPSVFWESLKIEPEYETKTFHELAKGDYLLRATDWRGCTDTTTAFVDGPNDSLHITYGTTLVDCHVKDSGEHVNGTISLLTTTDGYDPVVNNLYDDYIYNIWLEDSTDYTRSQADTLFDHLPVGNHLIQVVDKEGCQNYTFPITVRSNDSLTFKTYLYDEVCENTSNGKIHLSTEGGAGKHSYYMTSTDTSGFDRYPMTFEVDSAIYTSLPPAFGYQITVIDTNMCSQKTLKDSLPIYEYFNPKIEAGNFWFDSVHCYGETNGSVELHGTFGRHHYDTIGFKSIYVLNRDSVLMYVNDFNQTLPNEGYTTDSVFRRNDFAYGKHYFRIKDDSACWSNAVGITVEQPDTLLITLEDSSHVIGKGENSGLLKFSTSGGNSGKQIVSALNSSGLYNTLNIQQNIFDREWGGFIADTFTLKVNDYHNCTHQIDNIIIKEPEFPLTFSVKSKSNALCKANVGEFTLEGHGGWGNYEFKGAGRESFNAYTLFEGLFAGNYDITVTDSMGATYTDRVFIYEPKDSLKVIMDTVQHPTCGDNGVLSYQMSGGTSPYRLSYIPKDTFNVWSPYEYSATALAAGYYRASVFDSNNCQFEVEATLTDLKRLNITSLSIQEYATVDTGQGNGALRAVITGGTNNLLYWYKSTDTLNSLGDTTLITGLLPGIYQFVASSAEGCELSKAIYLPHMYDHPMRIIAIGHERGYETADGFAEFAVPIDTATTVILKHETHPDQLINLAEHPEMYNHSEHTLRIENLAGGDYIVIITDATDRVAFADFHINNYQLFELTNETLVDVIKHNDTNGSIQVGCKGGAGNNTYTWVCNSKPSLVLHAKNTEFSTLLDSIQAGTYNLTITDANGHTLNGTYTLQNPPPIEMAIKKFDVHCKDSADGFVDLTVKGGWGNFQYRVDTFANYKNSKRIFDLESRPYWFYAVDKRGALDSISTTIGEPEYLRSWVKFIDSVNCYNESNGNIHFMVTGGTLPYEFRHLGNEIWNRDTLDYNLAEGDYTYQFTDSNGCTGLDTLNVYMPQPDTLLFSNIWEKQATCGLDNAAISVTTQGGTEPYRYQWTNSRGIVIGTEPSMDSLVQLEQYYLAAFDYNNCIAKHNLQINSSTAPRVDSLHINPVICFGDTNGTARVITASAGEPPAPYYFEWSNADTSAFSGHFPKGDHYVTIKDTNNCATRRWFYMPQPDSLHTVLTGFTDAKCFGSATGFIQVKAKGGVGKYNFNWNTGDTVPVLDSLVEGAYALTLSDSNNCIFIDTFNIRQPEVLQSSLNYAEHLKCKADNNGLIAFSLQGGTAPYKYKLLENTFWLQGTRATGLAEGTYTYHFSDANECISPDTLNVAITAPDSLLFKSIDITHTTCNTNNGSIGVSLKGGVKPYRYKWTDMQNTVLDTLPFIDSLSQLAQYRIEVIDSNNCRVSKIEQISHSTVPTVLKIDTRPVLCWGDTTGTALIAKVDTAWPPAPVNFKWSNGDVGNASERFFEGNHYVVVTDTNGCSSKRYFTVTSPKPLEGHLIDLAEPSCFGDENGYMEIYAKGGVGCYAIKWSNADTRFKAEDLASGTYDYVLSDSNGCLFDETVELSQPAVLRSKIASIDSLECAGDHDGRVEFNVRGGTQPYYYKPLGSDMWISNTRVYQMNARKYVYEFTDAHSCVGADTVHLDMVEPDSLLFDSLNVQHTTCNKDNGSIYFTMKGGTPPYNYEWTNSYREVLSTQNYMDGLKRQNQYWLKVLDKKNCKFEFDKQIYGSSGPAIDQIGITDVLCIGDSTGRAEVLKVTPAEPYSPYYIEWSIGDTGMVNSKYYVGTHYATVIDATGCDSRRYFDMHGPDSLWVQVLDSAGAKCFNSTDGYISLAPKGGVGGYQAQWSNGDTTFNNVNLPVGTYQLVLTDSNRCSYQKTFEISQPDSIIINLGDDVTICPGNTYTLDGFEFAGHEWTLDGAPFSTERFAHLSQEGTYNVWVSNENGCLGTDEFYLTIGNDALKADFLMTSESNMGDTLNIIELSNLPLDSLQWAYDNDVFLDFTMEADPAYMLRLKSYSTGIYNVGLTAFSGGCISTKVKQVEIIDMSDTTDTFDYMGYNPLIESLHIAPNPSNGEFIAKITLREVADIQLVVYGVDKGNVIDMRESSGLDYYEIPYTLTNQQTGVYVLIVTASNERKQTKLIFK